MRKPGLSLDEHTVLGSDLHRMHQQLVDATVLLSRAFPVAHPVQRRVWRALNAVDDLRAALDSVACQQFPRMPSKGVLSLYYPGEEGEQ